MFVCEYSNMQFFRQIGQIIDFRHQNSILYLESKIPKIQFLLFPQLDFD